MARAVAPVPVVGMFFHELDVVSFPDELSVKVPNCDSPSGKSVLLLMGCSETARWPDGSAATALMQ